MSRYAKKTDRRPYEERSFSVRAVHRDRPTRQAAWPGEDPAPTIQDLTFTDRDTEFVEFVITQVRKRQEAEDEFYASLADDEGP